MSVLSSTSSSSSSSASSLSCQLSVDPGRPRGTILGWQRPPPSPRRSNLNDLVHRQSLTRQTRHSPYARPATKSNLVPSYYTTLPFTRGSSSPFHTPLFSTLPGSTSSSTSTSGRPLFTRDPLHTSPGHRERHRLHSSEAVAPPLIPLPSYESLISPSVFVREKDLANTPTAPGADRRLCDDHPLPHPQTQPRTQTQTKNKVDLVKPNRDSFVCVLQYETRKIYGIGAQDLKTTLRNLRLIFPALQGIPEDEVQLYGLIPRSSPDTGRRPESMDNPDTLEREEAEAGGLFLPSSSSSSSSSTSMDKPSDRNATQTTGSSSAQSGGTMTKAFRMTPSLYAEVRKAHLNHHARSPSTPTQPGCRQREVREEDDKTEGPRARIPHFMILTTPQLERLVLPKPATGSATKPVPKPAGSNQRSRVGSQPYLQTAIQNARQGKNPWKDLVRPAPCQQQGPAETGPNAPKLAGSADVSAHNPACSRARAEDMEVEPIQVQPVARTSSPKAATFGRFSNREEALSALVELSSKYSLTVDLEVSGDAKRIPKQPVDIGPDPMKDVQIDRVIVKEEADEERPSAEIVLAKPGRNDEPVATEDRSSSTEASVDETLVEIKSLVAVKTEPVDELMQVETPTVKSPPATPMKSLVADYITPPRPIVTKTEDGSKDIVDPICHLRSLMNPPVAFNFGQVDKRSRRKKTQRPLVLPTIDRMNHLPGRAMTKSERKLHLSLQTVFGGSGLS